jgi:hypothetical protein
MKIFKILVLFTAIVCSCIAIIWFTPLDDNNYLAAIRDKHSLLNRTKGKKIIFIGGSNLSFGLDSQLVATELGCQVINMGLHAELGIRYMTSEIKDSMKENDVVILVPEYNFIFDGYKTLLETVIFYPEALKYMDIWHYKVMLEFFPVTLQRRFKGFCEHLLWGKGYKRSHAIYSRKAFNQYGDVIGHLGKSKKKVLTGKLRIQMDSDSLAKTILHLNRFSELLKKRGGICFLTFPAIPSSRFKPARSGLNQLYKFLKEKASFTILGKPEDFILPDDCFYDTIYHLNSRGRELRTLKIIVKLNTWLQGQ